MFVLASRSESSGFESLSDAECPSYVRNLLELILVSLESAMASYKIPGLSADEIKGS